MPKKKTGCLVGVLAFLGLILFGLASPSNENTDSVVDDARTITSEVQIEETVTEEPTTEQPTTEEPTTEQPTTEEPTTEQPTTEEPTTEEPTTEEPTTEEPTTEEPATEQIVVAPEPEPVPEPEPAPVVAPEPIPAPEPERRQLVFVLNTDSNCVHINKDCSAAKQIEPENYQEITLWENELSNYQGVYWACGKCSKRYSDVLPKP